MLDLCDSVPVDCAVVAVTMFSSKRALNVNGHSLRFSLSLSKVRRESQLPKVIGHLT